MHENKIINNQETWDQKKNMGEQKYIRLDIFLPQLKEHKSSIHLGTKVLQAHIPKLRLNFCNWNLFTY